MNKNRREASDALDRSAFLERNRDELARRMAESGVLNPVGVVADVRDFHGRQFAIAMGMSDAEIDAGIAKYEGEMIPTLTSILTWEQARKIMPYTSPTATTNLNAAWRLRSLTGQALAIAITAKGNRYELVNLPEDAVTTPAGAPPARTGHIEFVRDGQTRYRGME